MIKRYKHSKETKEKMSENYKYHLVPNSFKKGHIPWNKGRKIPKEELIELREKAFKKYGWKTIFIDEVEVKNENLVLEKIYRGSD